MATTLAVINQEIDDIVARLDSCEKEKSKCLQDVLDAKRALEDHKETIDSYQELAEISNHSATTSRLSVSVNMLTRQTGRHENWLDEKEKDLADAKRLVQEYQDILAELHRIRNEYKETL